MLNPIKTWMSENKIKQGELALLAGVDRTDVTRVISGQRKLPKKLRQYLEANAPDVLNTYESYLVSVIDDLKKRMATA